MPKGLVFFRKLSALYLFFIALAIFVLLFYYKYIPGNKDELNQRGHRVLTQLIANFNKKDQDLHTIVNGAADSHSYDSLLHKNGAYSRLTRNIPYDTLADPFEKYRPRTAPLYKDEYGNWQLIYHWNSDSTPGIQDTGLCISVKMQNFAGPFLSAREDLFENYLILLDSLDPADRKSHSLVIIYRKNAVTLSEDMNVDTLPSLLKNSDKSTEFPVTISGEKYVLFSSPFGFHNNHLIMAGLVTQKTYDEKVTEAPLSAISLTIIFVSLLLISLPFLKAYLLSPKESVYSRDVLKTAASFYIGSAVITFIVFYSFLMYVTHLSHQNRLVHFSREIRADVEKDISLADQQLRYYDDSIGRRDEPSLVKRELATPPPQSKPGHSADSLCVPLLFNNISRLIWMDHDGRTIAKWNPYTFPTPFTNMQKFDFYQLLRKRPPPYDGLPGAGTPVIYPGKSNLTDEFQTFVARPSTAVFRKQSGDSGEKRASYIALAGNFRVSIQPVIPRGFGFCLIDSVGRVLIDGDAHRNLGENILDESANNHELSGIIHHKRSDITFALELYGEPCIARVVPIDHQSMYLVCYYDQKVVTKNIFRFLHFSIQTLLSLWTVLILCILISTYDEWRPILLQFNLTKREWIRPSGTARSPLIFTLTFFSFLTLLSALAFVVILFSPDLNDLFYLALLLPFYCLVGVQLSHVPRLNGGPNKPLVYLGAAKYPLSCVALVNIAIGLLICSTKGHFTGVLVEALFQIAVLWFLIQCCIRHPREWMRLGARLRKQDPVRTYLYSLYLSIMLIGIMPTLAILTYGFYAEKVQYKKEKMAAIGESFLRRTDYLSTDVIPPYKQGVLDRLGTNFQDSLYFHSSVYLTDRDTIEHSSSALPFDPEAASQNMPDGLYALLMDGIYQAPQIWGDNLSISNIAGDTSWYYQRPSASKILYTLTRPVGNQAVGAHYIAIESNLQKPHQDFWRLLPPVVILLFVLFVGVLGWLSKKLIDGVVNRLFLLDFFTKNNKIAVNTKYISAFFSAPDAVPVADPYLLGAPIPRPMTMRFFRFERRVGVWARTGKPWTPVEYILVMADYFAPLYEHIWNALSDEEQYVLFDFSNDRYTNFKNSTVLFRLINKGILVPESNMLDVFSPSFRQFVLSKKDTPCIAKLKTVYAVSGTWANIRIPVMSLIAVVAIFLFTTQAQFMGVIIAGITTLSTLVPMLVRLLTPSSGSSPGSAVRP